MALIDGKPRSASARTIEKTVINPILAERIRTLMDNANPAVRCFIETMAERLRKANEKLMELAPEAVEDDRPVD
jgi:CRP-like cAMP-binding protein